MIERPLPGSAEQPPSEAASAASESAAAIAHELVADRKRIEIVLNQLREAAADLRQTHETRLHQWQTAAVELALTIATRLLHEQVTADAFPVEAMVRDMVGQLDVEDAVVTVRLNPDDLELLERRLGGEPLLPGAGDPRLVPDTGLRRGECRVEGKDGILMLDVGRQLQEVRDELLRRLGHARS